MSAPIPHALTANKLVGYGGNTHKPSTSIHLCKCTHSHARTPPRTHTHAHLSGLSRITLTHSHSPIGRIRTYLYTPVYTIAFRITRVRHVCVCVCVNASMYVYNSLSMARRWGWCCEVRDMCAVCVRFHGLMSVRNRAIPNKQISRHTHTLALALTLKLTHVPL